MNVRSGLTSAAATCIAPFVARYIRLQRDRLAERAAPLTESESRAVQQYFADGDLDRIRILIADPLPIAVPPFVGAVRRIGFKFPDVRLVSGITFDNVIGLREPPTPNLLFHELVHAVQFRVMGVDEFASQYVRGFFHARCYDDIPLERCAHELETRFIVFREAFKVEDEVRQWMEAGRF